MPEASSKVSLRGLLVLTGAAVLAGGCGGGLSQLGTFGLSSGPAGGSLTLPGASGRRDASSSERKKHPAKGETIEVQAGDTLSGLADRHGVGVAELRRSNALKSDSLKPGQKLTLPATARRQPLPKRENIARVTYSPDVRAQRGNWRGSYTVKPGDKLYDIALAHNITVVELQSVNEIADANKIRPGMVLRVPAIGGDAAAPEAPPKTATVPPAAKKSEATADATPAFALLRPPAKAAAGAELKLRWPVQGRLISGFGQRADGTHNDGVNVAVPLGTDVHAAESGVVVSAGSELKRHGNLVLVRHDNGWVTAYAHNDRILVRRGDRVQRGQVIAKAGQSGGVDQPQVHFELRRDSSRPVDPMPYMSTAQ
ncbi:MAG: LysM peptidoglycan-binding domain-containing protein [Hyphomicrobiaceae bacterium]